jgi:4-azaleucine resistance transporter AzlC
VVTLQLKYNPKGISIFLSYLSMSFIWGGILQQMGGSLTEGFLVSLLSFAGSAQFLYLKFKNTEVPILVTFLGFSALNSRHLIYSFFQIHHVKDRSLIHKLYYLFALTDEHYALEQIRLSQTPVIHHYSIITTFLINHAAWVTGTLLGIMFGEHLNIDIAYAELLLTIFFSIFAIESLKSLFYEK